MNMNKRTIFVNSELVAKALVENVEIRPGDGNLDAYGRTVARSFPPISPMDIFSNLDSRMVKLQNRWTYILPSKKALINQIRIERDWTIADHSRNGNKIRSKETGRMVNCSDFSNKLNMCNKLLQDLLPSIKK